MNDEDITVAFLGLCERALSYNCGDPFEWAFDVAGLRRLIHSPIFPLDLRGYSFAFAVYHPMSAESLRLSLFSEDRKEILCWVVSAKGSPIPYQIEVAHEFPFWEIVFLPVPKSAMVAKPGRIKVVVNKNNRASSIGYLTFKLASVPPLTDDRILALKSQPNAGKWVRLSMRCDSCGDEIKAYTGIERSEKAEREGWTWYTELPETFTCKCGNLNHDLQSIRTNLHALLGHATSKNEEVSFTRLYETRALDVIGNEFESLLDSRPSEENVQQFIKDNPILLQQFSPERIFFKAPILTKHKTDIVILNHKKELILIELEKPGLSLLKKDGGQSAPLQHPFKQVRDWLDESDFHRIAVLSCIDISPEEVGTVRGVVIAGRDYGYDEDHLRKLKGADFGRISFFTYDDLLKGLQLLSRSMSGV